MKSFLTVLTVILSSTFTSSAAASCGDSKYVAEVFWMSSNGWCPRLSLPAFGQRLQVSEYSTLYSLLGTSFGGDNRSYFNLPDLRGRMPMGQGFGAGLTQRTVGQQVGSEQVTLSTANLPAHAHSVAVTGSVSASITATNQAANTSDPENSYLANSQRAAIYRKAADTDSTVTLAGNDTSGSLAASTGDTGSNQPVYFLPPAVVMTPCICTDGIYPSRP